MATVILVFGGQIRELIKNVKKRDAMSHFSDFLSMLSTGISG
jgi:hypothetical protein